MRASGKQIAACIALLAAVTAMSAMAGPGAHGPGGEHLDAFPDGASPTGLARLPDGSVSVPKLAQRRMAVRTVVGRIGEHALTTELNGKVAIDPNAGGRVQAPFAGRIAPGPQGLPVAGQPVRKGQVLAYLRATTGAFERANQQALLADLRADRALADKRVQRLQALEGTVPRKEIEAAQAELASLTAREKTIAASLSDSEAIVAPIAGVIATASVLAGQIVSAQDRLYDIVDPDRMIVEAYTADATLATRIASASLRETDGVSLQFVGAARSLREGMLPLTFRASMRGVALAVDQPVTVVAKLNEPIAGIAIPAAAVVRSPTNEPIVWIKASAERFIAQPVHVRALDARTVVVTSGLAPDHRVVVAGASMINQIR